VKLTERDAKDGRKWPLLTWGHVFDELRVQMFQGHAELAKRFEGIYFDDQGSLSETQPFCERLNLSITEAKCDHVRYKPTDLASEQPAEESRASQEQRRDDSWQAQCAELSHP
jgi:hypothetical protein